MSERYHQYFKLFTQMSTAIHSGDNPKAIIESIVIHATQLTRARGAIFWIIDRSAQKIESFISHGFEYRSLAGVDYDTLVAIFNPHEASSTFIEDARYDRRIPDLERLGKKRIGSVTGINLDITSQYSGILAVYFSNIRQLTDDEQELVNALGEQAAIALNKALSFDGHILKLLRQMVEGFVLAIEARDESTHGHSMKVAQLAKLVSAEMGLDEATVETIFHAGMLHDIGKIGLEDYILEHLGVLNRKEMDRVRKHPEIGAGIVKPLTVMPDLAPIIRHHHERYDGTGYPDGLTGKAIPLGARIVCACDVFETMMSGRKHLEKRSLEDALAALKQGATAHFDPEVVDALITAIRKTPELIGCGETRDRVDRICENLDEMALKSLNDPCRNYPICF